MPTAGLKPFCKVGLNRNFAQPTKWQAAMQADWPVFFETI